MAVDDRKDVGVCYQITNFNEPGTYWNDFEGIVTDTSDMILSMISIEDDSDYEPKSEPDVDGESEPEPVIFDVNNPGNIFARALHQAALARTLS